MTKDLALTLLDRGTNGTEILDILDAVVAQVEDTNIQDFVDYAVSLNAEVQGWLNSWWWGRVWHSALLYVMISELVFRQLNAPISYSRVAALSVYKKANYPNLQRWQIDL